MFLSICNILVLHVLENKQLLYSLSCSIIMPVFLEMMDKLLSVARMTPLRRAVFEGDD